MELKFELLKKLGRRMDSLDPDWTRSSPRWTPCSASIIDLHRDVAELKADVRVLTADNLSFRGYSDPLTWDTNRNVT